MEKTINIDEITDIKELKALKSDQHDLIESARQTLELASLNIQKIVTRINQIEDKPKED